MREEWRAIPAFPGYEASNLGRIRGPKSILKQVPIGLYGYLQVGLKCVAPDGQSASATRYVHLLVLRAFRGPRPPGHEGCHNNDINADNSLENLRWDTPAANSADRERQSARCHAFRRWYRGSNRSRAKLVEGDITRIRDLLCCGISCRQIGIWFGVDHKTIGYIATGNTWTHVSDGVNPP